MQHAHLSPNPKTTSSPPRRRPACSARRRGAGTPSELFAGQGPPVEPADDDSVSGAGLKVGRRVLQPARHEARRGHRGHPARRRFVRFDQRHPPADEALVRRGARPRRRSSGGGITPLSCGVVTMQNDEANCRAAFEYARDIGVPVIVCNPHPDSFPILDKMVKEFDIKLAIHNHGPESQRFKSPYDAMKAAEKFDERIGLCIDVGHTARMNVDPAEAIRKCAAALRRATSRTSPTSQREQRRRDGPRRAGRPRRCSRRCSTSSSPTTPASSTRRTPRTRCPGFAESVGYLRGVISCL